MIDLFEHAIARSIDTGEIVPIDTESMDEAQFLARELADAHGVEGLDVIFENDNSVVVHAGDWAVRFTGQWVDDIGPDRWVSGGAQ